MRASHFSSIGYDLTKVNLKLCVAK